METDPAISGNSLVLIGRFDPSSVQPKNLFRQGILRDNDLASMVIDLAIPEAFAMTLDWIVFGVEKERFTAGTQIAAPFFEPVRDFVLNVIEEMTECEISAFGINLDTHFAMSNIVEWNAIGDILVPKDTLWRKLSPKPGMLSLSTQLSRYDNNAGFTRVRVEPSLKVPNGIYVQVNDHYELKKKSASDFTTLLEGVWDDSLRQTDNIIKQVRALPQGD